MPKKLSDYTPTQTTIKLLVCLLENDRFYTLSELAEKFEVSKPTVARSLERPDLTFFGKLIKEKLGREVAYRIDKSKLLNRLVRANSRPVSQTRPISKKAYCAVKKGTRENALARAEKRRIFKLDITRNPLLLAVLEYMNKKGNERRI